MTKQEIKALVASKIEGQGNQVDLGSALSAILGEILDRVPERAPITIDLSEFELSDTETDVTSAFPSGYVPQAGDKILYDQKEFGLEGFVTKEGDTTATFGYGNEVIDAASIIYLTQSEGVWYAGFRDF